MLLTSLYIEIDTLHAVYYALLTIYCLTLLLMFLLFGAKSTLRVPYNNYASTIITGRDLMFTFFLFPTILLVALQYLDVN